MPKGKIKKTIYGKGYGFIKAEDGEVIFFHAKNLLNSKSIKKGNPVEFDIAKDKWGRLVAINIRLIHLYNFLIPAFAYLTYFLDE